MNQASHKCYLCFTHTHTITEALLYKIRIITGKLFAYEVCMMKNTKLSKKNNRGAALMIALLAAVIVMMAASLLIGLTRRLVDAHVERISSAQIALSESSAADGLAFMLSQRGLGVAYEPLHFELAAVLTEFTYLETGTAGIRTGFYSVENPQDAVFIPAGNRLVSVQKIDQTSVLVTFFSGDTFNPVSEYTFETDLFPAAGIPFVYQGAEGVVVVFEDGEKTLIAVMTSEGVQVQAMIDSRVLSSGSRLFATEAPNGSPLLIITGGSNAGTLYNLLSGEAVRIGSPSGTCPAFLSDGTMFGGMTQVHPSFGAAHVVDAFSGDFNNDGMEDMVFATRFSLSVYSGSTGDILRSSPGGSLSSWGSVGGRTGLCGMWDMPVGSDRWFRLGFDGFTEFNPEMVYELGWQGRFQGQGNTLTGFIDGIAVIASSSGYIQELLTGEMFIGDADGGETDFFSISEDGVDACFNPVNGDGVKLAFSALNQYRGRRIPGETYIFSIYESNGGIRVFHTIEGLDL